METTGRLSARLVGVALVLLLGGCTALMAPMPASVADGEPLECPDAALAYFDAVSATGYGLLTVAAVRDLDTCEGQAWIGCSYTHLALVTALPLALVHAAMSYGGFREHQRCARIHDARRTLADGVGQRHRDADGASQGDSP